MEEPMTTTDFITALFYEVAEQIGAIPKHPEAHLWPSEVVTLGLLHALKGGGNRAFYRWLTRDYRALFPHRLRPRLGRWRLRGFSLMFGIIPALKMALRFDVESNPPS